MTAVIRHITFDVAPPYEPYDLAGFWSQVVGHPVSGEDEPGDDEVLVESTPGLLFVRVPEAKTLKNRVHLDVRAAPGLRGDERMAALEAEAERLVAHGATRLRRHEPAEPLEPGHLVMADPEGNEFCLD